jgi:hypothetical protein
MEATPKPAQPQSHSLDDWIKSLSQKEAKIQISSCLDEYESCVEKVVKMGNRMTPEGLKELRGWAEHQKHILRMLGYNKRMPAIRMASKDVDEIV